MTAPRVLILRAPGINRDQDAAHACELAGARPERIHVNRVAEGGVRLDDFAMLVIPGGFSYGDHLGAGRLLAVDLEHRLGEQIQRFVAADRPVIGICNGFQVLVKAGILPGIDNKPPSTGAAEGRRASDDQQARRAARQCLVTLTDNSSNRFECRWVRLRPEPASRCRFTQGIEGELELPVAHGEGRIAVQDAAALAALRVAGLVALRYSTPADGPAYPANPNGSPDNIAGLCNPQGNVLGLMPHPENAVRPQQHPRWTREPQRREGDGLVIFRNAVQYAASL
jgi:phosphoribosylformylglycinamidine synthase